MSDDFNFEFKKVPIKDARAALVGEVKPKLGITQRDRANEVVELTDVAKVWLARLDGKVETKALVEKYARIVNKLAETWQDRTATQELLKSYLLDDRGSRQGFPFDVAMCIADIKHYFDQLAEAEKKDVFDHVKVSKRNARENE